MKLRIVSDNYCGYEVQVWRWWFPFWVEAGFTNTHATLEGAERWALGYIKPVVKCIELPK